MATSPAAPVSAAIQALQSEIKLNISGTLPGEALAIALVQAWSAARSRMDPAMQARLDTIFCQQMEDLQHVWRGIWIALGVVKP